MIKVKKLVWDKFNLEHIKKHGVTKEEVRLAGRNILFSIKTYNNRIRITGRAGKRLISLILNPQIDPGAYYVVSARDASKKERKVIYEIETKKNT